MKASNRLRISIVDLTFLIWALAVPLALRGRLLNADGDFPRHLTMGEFILRGGVFQIDSFAHTHSGPFLTTEWLSQVAYALAYRAGDLAGVAALAGLIIGTVYALAVLFMRRAGVDPLLAYLAGIVAAILGAPHFVARPHLFTFLGLAVLLHLALPARNRRIWLFAPFFLVWANFHPGFILGIAILLTLAAGQLAEAWLAKEPVARADSLGRARFLGLGSLIGLAASMVNPQGFGLLQRIFGVLGNDYLLRSTAEFNSLDFHTLYGKLVLAVLAGLITLFALRKERPAFPRLFVILLLLSGALYAARNAPLFGVVAIPLLAIEFDGLWRTVRPHWLQRIRGVFDNGERIAIPGRLMPVSLALLLLLMLTRGVVAGTRVVPNDFDGSKFPVAAVRAAREAGLDGRMYNWFTWGGYILHAWPEQQIFIDGMTDFLGNAVMQSYLKIEYLDPGWQQELERHDVSLVIVPPDTRLASALRESHRWQVWREDSTAIILVAAPD